MSKLAIIPARAGSKRLPGKNTMLLAGKPLAQWSIDAALKSNLFDRICVSTDCDILLELAVQTGVDAPFRRPEELSSDTASSVDVVLHTLSHYEKRGEHFTSVTLLQPTSPLRHHDDLIQAHRLFEQRAAGGIISVCECEHSPLWANTLPADGSLEYFLRKDLLNKRSQDLDKFYRLNGAIYITAVNEFKAHKTLMVPNSYAYVMPMERSVDIDTIYDFKLAEFILSEAVK